ncbi:MAG TPA: hypothetical protein PKO18_04865, partial [Chitinophagales bacterium]|nr:hypothetical protein [Chitinophagales bacterium]
IHSRLASTVVGRFFFQPLNLHFESPNLFIQFNFDFTLLAASFVCSFAKYVVARLEQLPFPFTYLRRVQFIFTAQLTQGFLFFCCFKGHFEFEFRTVLFPFASHFFLHINKVEELKGGGST